jgi:hypothetical protein
MEHRALKNVNNYLNTNIYSYLEKSGGLSFSLSLNVVHCSTQMLIRHLWQLKTVVFPHWCLICVVLLIQLMQGTLAEGEGSVRSTSSLRQVVF